MTAYRKLPMLPILMISLMVGFVTEAFAQADPTPSFFTSYVSGNGSGTICSQTQPCRSIQAAFLQTITGGAIVCLDTADFAGAKFTRSVTLDCTGNTIGTSVIVPIQGSSSCPCATFVIDIPASSGPRDVKIRGLGLSHAGGGIYGIYIRSAGSVSIENSSFNVLGGAIVDARTGGQSRLYVTNTVITNSRAPGIIAAAQGPAATVLDNVSLLNNTYGIAAATGNNVVITRSTISGNTTAGISTDGGSQINLLNSVMSHNTLHANNYGTVRLQENTLQFSNTAVQGNVPISLGANRFIGNGSLGATPVLASGAPADVFN